MPFNDVQPLPQPLSEVDTLARLQRTPSYAEQSGGRNEGGFASNVGLVPATFLQTQDLQRQPIRPDSSALAGMFEAFVKTCERWQLKQPDQAILLGYQDHQFLGQQLLMGFMPPRTQDVKDRIGYVLAISLGLGTLFNEDAAVERGWLNTEHGLLRGTTPLQFLLQGHMANLIDVAEIVRRERGL